VLAAVTAVLLALGIGAGVWYINVGQFTTVPPVLRLSQQEAERKLRGAGLDVSVEQEFSDVVDRGQVMDTDPGPGGRIRNTGTVTIVVSKGPEVVKVPDLQGTPLARARQKLQRLGLVPGLISRQFNEAVPQGSVIGTDPKAGTERRPDSAIAIVVSKGRPVEVPDVIGASVADARAKLREAGFTAQIAPQRVFSGEERNTVARQSPGEGTALAEGDTITLTLSKGPEMAEVPDVEGRNVDEATRALEDAGFAVRVTRFFFGDTVFDQSVDAGDEAPKGSTITIRVR
jgi:serine/threonine-protein kinase